MTSHGNHHPATMQENSAGEPYQGSPDGKMSKWPAIRRVGAIVITAAVFLWIVIRWNVLSGQVLANGHPEPTVIGPAQLMSGLLMIVGLVYVFFALAMGVSWIGRKFLLSSFVWMLVDIGMVALACWCWVSIGPLTQP